MPPANARLTVSPATVPKVLFPNVPPHDMTGFLTDTPLRFFALYAVIDFCSQLMPYDELLLRLTSRMTASMSTCASMMSTFLMTSSSAAMSPFVPMSSNVFVRVSARIFVSLESWPIFATASFAAFRSEALARARTKFSSACARESSPLAVLRPPPGTLLESLDELDAPMKLFSSDAISSASANSRFTTCTSTSGSTDTSSALTIMLKNGRFTGFVMTMMMFVRSSVRILTFPWMIPFSAAVAAVEAALCCVPSSGGGVGWRARIMLGIRRGSGLATRATSSFCSLSLASSLSRAAMSAAFACRMTYTLVSTFSSVGWSTISRMSLIRRRFVEVSSTSRLLMRSSRCTFPYPWSIAPTMLFASSIPRYFSRISWLTSASLSG